MEETCSTDMILLSFLQLGETQDEHFNRELHLLDKELKTRGPMSTVFFNQYIYHYEDELQTDGHFCSNFRNYLGDIAPELRANAANEEALREIARHLADIADHLDQRMIAEAAQNLSQHMQSVNLRQDWVGLLSTEIQNFMRHGIPGLQYANEERVMVALTMALVKRIGLQFPTLLRSFFSTAVQYINENIQTQINQT
ncbi:BH3-interacting domain death agonist-like isoform X2 [Polypterus senegalus]|nr:BH3-interacting domain death agonist-like isoform X2 [Polypterus senegalus]XP_039626006.1 BH3-interacting domain death agonist-like isoform X2 [Polypterus senegalus]